MNSFIALAALVACAFAADSKVHSVSSVSYGVPSGSVSFTSSVSSDAAPGTYGQGAYGQGVYGQGVYGKSVYGQGTYGQGGAYSQGVHQAKFDHVQPVVPQVKYYQPEVKPVDYVHDVKPATVYKHVQPVETVGYVQPTVRHVKPVEYVQPFVQRYVHQGEHVQPAVRYYQPAVKPVEYVQPSVKYVQPVVKPDDYVHPAFKFAQPVVKTVDYVQPAAKRVDHFQPAVKHFQPVVKTVEPVHYVNKPVDFVQPAFRFAQPTFKYVQPHEEVVKHVPAILRMNQDATIDGHFNYGFESEDGITAVASGAVKAIEGTQDASQVMQGSYSYVAPDGTPVATSWYADETGFHADGSHLPVAPPVPEAIARSLEYLRSLPPNPEDLKYDYENAKH